MVVPVFDQPYVDLDQRWDQPMHHPNVHGSFVIYWIRFIRFPAESSYNPNCLRFQ